jgi:coenzyme F420-reducing hydrogenase beta subunit
MLAEQVIDNGGVVYGAAFDANFQLKHCYVDSKNDLEKLRGSKYLQSQIGSTYKQAKGFLDSGRKVLFSGTPCQIAGFKSYLIKSYENLLTIDIICHGVPSPKVWEKYIEFRQHKAGSLAKSVSFRDKSEGWKQSSIAFLFNDNEKYRENLRNDLYMKAFLNNICLRPSCYECQFKTLNRQSDITLADFWGIVNIIPELDDDKGTSLVFVNSNRGKIFFENILTEAKFKEVNINKALEYNSAAIESAKNNSNRNSFFADLERLKFDKLVKKYCTEKLYIRVKNKEKIIIRRFLHKVGLLSIVKKLLESVNQILCKGDSTL